MMHFWQHLQKNMHHCCFVWMNLKRSHLCLLPVAVYILAEYK